MPYSEYFSGEQFAAEADLFGRKCWFFLGHSSEFREVGVFYRLPVWNFEVLVHFDGEQFQCWLNACPHRGSALCSEDLTRDSVTCPYHGLKFNTAGLAEAVWNGKSVSFKMQALQVSTLGSFLFCSHNPALGLRESVGEFFEEIASWSQGIIRLAAKDIISVSQNWKLLMENLTECLHAPMVHPKSLGRHGAATPGYEAQYHFSSLSSMLKSKSTTLSTRELEVYHKRSAGRAVKVEKYHHFHLFPNFNLATELGFFYVQISVRPQQVDQSLLETRIYLPDSHQSSGLGPHHFNYIRDQVLSILKEDVQVIAGMGRSMTYLVKSPSYTDLEKRAEFFNRNVKSFLKAND